MEKLEKQFQKIYVCKSCNRIMHLFKHFRKCPFCGGTLTVTCFTVKEANKRLPQMKRGE